jgi:fatty acid desaturase
VEGAHNLKTNLLLEKLLLNGNWDYEHHLRPDLPWIYLKDQGRENKKVAPVSYLKQYLKLWSGPIRNTEAPPSPLPRLEYIETYKS